MKRLSLFPLLGLTSLHGQDNGIDQPFNFIAPPTGGKFVEWYGKLGYSYFMQVSDPAAHLSKWKWAPVIEGGNAENISYEVDATADKAFYRLAYTDQTAPDLDSADFDGDGISNLAKITPDSTDGTQTNPLDPDTDHDGLSDKWERDHGLDPKDDGGTDPNNGPNGDLDGDGVSNANEQAHGTDPNLTDTDGDGANDGDEINSGHDPLSSQSYPPVWRKAQRTIARVLGIVWTYAGWTSPSGQVHYDDTAPEDYAVILSQDIIFPTTEADPKVRPRRG